MNSTKAKAWSLRSALALGSLLVAAPALAATWTPPRTTPSLLELFAIDATGEPGWIYGAEDVAGDGLASFKQQEKNIDIRTAYAVADANDLWVRTYISDTQGPGGNVAVYIFIDSNKDATSGGSAAATTINAKFTEDPSPGGYEYVIGIKGNQSVIGVWKWDGAQWATENVPPNQIVPEASTDTDPILIGDPVHGYIQAKIALSVVELTAACNANLYVRSSNETGGLGAGDLEVGQVGSCIPTDANNNGVPDPLEDATKDCTSDDHCPGDGLCQNGKCIFPLPCLENADCKLAGYVCTTDGRCVPQGGGSCTTNADCQNGLVCISGTCQACTPGGTQCGAGLECAPDGRCVTDLPPGETCTSNDDCTDGRVCLGGSCTNCTPGSDQCGSGVECGDDGRCVGGLAPDDGSEQGGQDVQGGACACSLPGTGAANAWILMFSLPTALVVRRLRRRRSR
jgi:hypothetical protein